MIVNHQLKAAYFSLSKEEMERFDYQIGDSEGFVNFPLSIKGIVFSTFIMEKDDKVKFSFRSRGSFDVNLFARKYYNGGGHKNAAGGKIYKQLNEAVADFEKYLKEYENDLANSL
jgi:phosphoesterase RecJ-like protein